MSIRAPPMNILIFLTDASAPYWQELLQRYVTENSPTPKDTYTLLTHVLQVLARQQSSSYPAIPIDVRVKQRSTTKATVADVPAAAQYLEPLRKFISQTKRFNEHADAMIKKIQADYPTPADLASLIGGDRSRLLVALEIAWFECKHPASKSKSAMLAQLLEMGCFPRKFAVKAVLKRSRAEEAVNYFFSEAKTASDEDESEDAVLTNAAQASEALKAFVKAEPAESSKDSDGKAAVAVSELQNIAEIEAKVDFSQLLETVTAARSALESISDLKELVFPLVSGMYDRVEAMAQQQKPAQASPPQVSESERRLLLQSLMQRCSHARSAASLRCFAGHALVLESCQQQARCTLCSLPLPTSVQRFACSVLKPGSKTSKQCDFGMCVACAKEHTVGQSALYSPFDIKSSLHTLERLLPHGKLHANMKLAFASIASSPEFAFAPIVLFGWKSPDIPRRIVPSGDICGPDCSKEHADDSAVCIRCDGRYSRHKGHLCNDGERGYFIVSQSEDEGHSPLVQGPQGSQDIDMRHSSARPISLVVSEGLLSGRKWTCTLANTSERGRNTWIGLCDADVVAQYVATTDFKGLGARAKGFSIGIHHELGVRLDDKTTPRAFVCKDGEGITLEYDEPGRKLDVIIGKKVVYSHAGLPSNLVFAISSGDKKSKYAAVKCRQIDAPISVDAERSSLLHAILKAIEGTESWNSDTFFSLLSFLSTLRTKPHHVLCSNFLRPLQATLLRSITQLIESDELNAVTSRTAACDDIFTELGHAIELNRKALLLASVVQLKRVSIALIQGRCGLRSDSLNFLSKLFAMCSKGFAHTTAAAFDYLVTRVANLGASKSTVNYVSIPRWVIEAIDPSRSFVSVFNMYGTRFPAMLHAGWFDLETKDGASVRLSCEAAQLLLNRLEGKEALVSDTMAPVLKIGCVAASADSELAMNGLHELHSDSDIAQTPLQTASLPNSIHIGSSCINAVAWFKSKLCAQPSTDEIEALAACCKDTGSSPAIVQSVLTDLVRRGFVLRRRGHISLANADAVDSMAVANDAEQEKRPSHDDGHASARAQQVQQSLVEMFCKLHTADQIQDLKVAPTILSKQSLPAALPLSDAFKLLQAVFFTIEESASPSPWASSISSAASVSVKDFESDLADTLDGLQSLQKCDDILKTAREFEESSGSVTSFVFKRSSDIVPSSLPAIASSTRGSCPVCYDPEQLELLCSPCGHSACRGCYRDLMQTVISDSGSPSIAKGYENLLSITAIKCMGRGCQEHLPLKFLQETVPDLADVTQRMLVRTLLRILNNSTCPIATCLCGQSILIGTSQDCEAICNECGRCATIGDFKRKEVCTPTLPFNPHIITVCANPKS